LRTAEVTVKLQIDGANARNEAKIWEGTEKHG
jgi:hypothetical protein